MSKIIGLAISLTEHPYLEAISIDDGSVQAPHRHVAVSG